MGAMPNQYSLSCPYCGTDWPCPSYFFTTYAGRTVTRWCDTCQRLFDVEVPQSRTAPQP
jgi:hypothetical protein